MLISQIFPSLPGGAGISLSPADFTVPTAGLPAATVAAALVCCGASRERTSWSIWLVRLGGYQQNALAVLRIDPALDRLPLLQRLGLVAEAEGLRDLDLVRFLPGELDADMKAPDVLVDLGEGMLPR